MPNGNTHADLSAYSKEWCDERHDRIDSGLGKINERLDKTEEKLVGISMSLTEMKGQVASIRSTVDVLSTRLTEQPSEKAENAMWRKLLPWLIAAVFAGGGGASLIRDTVAPAASAPTVQVLPSSPAGNP